MPGLPTVRIDPHVHSRGSYDGHDPVELLLEQASDIGLDGVVVTDHDAIGESLRAAELAPEYGLIGVPGVEVSTADGHLLAIGVDELPQPGRPLAETVASVRALGGAAVVPHPFQRTRHGVRKSKLTDCDAVEIYNAWLFTGYRNRRARRFARQHGYASVAGSDAHTIKTVGRASTEIAFSRDTDPENIGSDDIVTAIKNGATAIHGRRAPVHRSAGHYLRGAGKKTSYVIASMVPGI